MQRICNKYANVCIEYAQNMQKIYAKICKYMQFICKNMQIYAAQFVPQKYAKICKNMQSICMLYAKTCKICNHVFYMQNMQKYALPRHFADGPGPGPAGINAQEVKKKLIIHDPHGHSAAQAAMRS